METTSLDQLRLNTVCNGYIVASECRGVLSHQCFKQCLLCFTQCSSIVIRKENIECLGYCELLPFTVNIDFTHGNVKVVATDCCDGGFEFNGISYGYHGVTAFVLRLSGEHCICSSPGYALEFITSTSMFSPLNFTRSVSFIGNTGTMKRRVAVAFKPMS